MVTSDDLTLHKFLGFQSIFDLSVLRICGIRERGYRGGAREGVDLRGKGFQWCCRGLVAAHNASEWIYKVFNKKGYGRTYGRTDGETSSLLELLIAAKNLFTTQIMI